MSVLFPDPPTGRNADDMGLPTGDPSMPLPHQLRVQVEHAELEARHDKLGAFLHSDVFERLDKEEQELLVEQFDKMYDLLTVLEKRIARWSAGEPPAAIHEVIGGPPPESDEFLAEQGSPAPRASILKVLGEHAILATMEPPEVFDRHMLGVTLIDDRPRVIYSEQGVIAAIADHKKMSLPDAWNQFNEKRDELRADGTPPPIFMTDIADLMAGG